MGKRQETRDRIEAQIIEVGRRHLVTDGAAGLSLRAIAREIGLVSSAVYRYVASRDDLLALARAIVRPTKWGLYDRDALDTWVQGRICLLGDAAHTMPPTLAQGTNAALLDTMVLCKALSDPRIGDPVRALRKYEKTRRRSVMAVSRVASLQVSHSEAVLKPAAMISDRLMTWALMSFLRSVSHRRMSAEISQDLAISVTR